jgi:hypothetical protein
MCAEGCRFFAFTPPTAVQYFGMNTDFILKNHDFVPTYWNLENLRELHHSQAFCHFSLFTIHSIYCPSLKNGFQYDGINLEI